MFYGHCKLETNSRTYRLGRINAFRWWINIKCSIEGQHFYLIGLLVAAFIIFLTEFTSNTASAALLVPIFISIAQSLGMPEIGLALIIGLGASCAFMLPVATPPNAIVFGSGQVKQSEMVKAGFVLNLVCILVISTMGYLFWLN